MIIYMPASLLEHRPERYAGSGQRADLGRGAGHVPPSRIIAGGPLERPPCSRKRPGHVRSVDSQRDDHPDVIPAPPGLGHYVHLGDRAAVLAGEAALEAATDGSPGAAAPTWGTDRVLSWGMCRPDLRNTVTVGDVAVFMAADRLSDRPSARYQLAGWATVERTVSQLDIWQQEKLAVYRHYSNLLIRPADAALIKAATAGWRRSRSRARARLGPMLPMGMPSLALISAYGTGGSAISNASSRW
jgi:hypothetical protein